MLEEGKSLALVSDAGTPTISDPGVLLVEHVYKHFGSDIQIIPIPGASAVVAALSASGLPSSDFLFLGFLPHKKGRMTLFNEITESERTVVFYESTHRILKALESLRECLAPDRIIVIARELTKHFESIKRGTAEELLSYFASKPDEVRGEFVVIVEAKDNSRKKNSEL
jgi:16S rRNA (cytidine1402-2'-O)-methyltransferase